MNDGHLTPLQRFFLAFIAFFSVLFDRRFAEAVQQVRERQRLLPPQGGTPTPEPAARTAAPLTSPTVAPRAAAPPTPPAAPPKAPASPPVVIPTPVAPPAPSPEVVALHVLGLLQRDGRLVDFLSEDLNGFSDAEIGAAARTVHEGCRKTLAYVELEPIYRDAEGATVTVAPGFDPATVRLTGNVVGHPPFRGSLRHHGWRARKASFPPVTAGHDARVLAPAEVEL